MISAYQYLIVSDIHSSWDFLKKLGEDINQLKLDGVLNNFRGILCLGDVINVDHFNEGDAQKEILEFNKVFDMLKKIHDRILYVPGNHDPKFCYWDIVEEEEFKNHEIEGIINFNDKVVELEPGLKLVGLGGSTNSYFKEDKEPYWKGFPYSEAKVNKKMKSLMEQVEFEKFILVTHQGPSNSSTVELYENHELMDSGSKSIYQVLLEHNPMIHLHGHSHKAIGINSTFGYPIVNPGALKYGKYSILSIKEDNKSKFKIHSINMY